MKRRLIPLLCALFCLMGCVEKEPEPQPIHLVIKTRVRTMSAAADPSVASSYDFLSQAAQAFVESYQAAPVTVEVVQYNAAEAEAAITDCYGTPAAPDVLYDDFSALSEHLYTGHVIPLDDLIDDDWRADVSEGYWAMGTAGDRTYLLPFLARQDLMVYRKSLFRQCGLEDFVADRGVQSWTLEEWETILSTLRANLPEDAYPMGMWAGSASGDTSVMALLRSHGSSFFNASDEVELNTPQGVAALRWLKECYDKGYFPPRCETLDPADSYTLFSNGQLAITVLSGPGVFFDDEDVGLANFPTQDGEGLCTASVVGFAVFDNGDPDKLQVARDFLSYLYHTPRWLDYSAGAQPVSRRVAADYQDRVHRLDELAENELRLADISHNVPNWAQVRQCFYPRIQDLLLGVLSPAETARALEEECNAAIRSGREAGSLHP